MNLLISTACYYRKNNDINSITSHIITHDVDGAEIAVLNAVNYVTSSINPVNFKCCKMHAACKNVVYDDNDFACEVLDKTRLDYKRNKCDNITFHYQNFKDPMFVLDYLSDCNLSVEYPDLKSSNKNVNKELSTFLQKYKDFNLVLDVCHALERRAGLELFLSNPLFMERLIEVHWSYPGTLLNHDVFPKDEYGTRLRDIILELDKDIVIELDLRKRSSLEELGLVEKKYLMRKEVEFIKASSNWIPST